MVRIVDVDPGRVLDLTDPTERDRRGLDNAALQSDEHAPCQDVGRTARRAGYEGIRYPSAVRDGGVNLVVFLDRVRSGSVVRVKLVRELEPG